MIYEKADRIGGTWRENTYPGLTCDVPSHHYTYTFERNPDWTRHLPPGPEIQDYFQHTCDKYGIKLALYFSEGDWNWPGLVDMLLLSLTCGGFL